MMIRLLLLSVVLFVGAARGTDRPIVGVLTQELETPGWRNYTSFLPAQYVKAVEASGARVVPVLIGQPLQYYRNMTSWLNGILVPGGNSRLDIPGGIAEATATIYRLAKRVKDMGGYLPMLGVCQGMELLAWVTGGLSSEVLVPCDAENLSLPLSLTPEAPLSSLYAHAYPEDLTLLTRLPVTSNHHRNCVTEGSLRRTGSLGMWRVLSTNEDRGGLEFVSSMERSDGYPFAGVQFHPEKPAWEWSPKQWNPHTGAAVSANRLFYDWLVAASRLSPTRFPDPTLERDLLIYNYQPLYSAKSGQYDTQAYFFY